jgi:murein DD-endopeptidase MepM/ murein hydrolase activator NlpD
MKRTDPLLLRIVSLTLILTLAPFAHGGPVSKKEKRLALRGKLSDIKSKINTVQAKIVQTRRSEVAILSDLSQSKSMLMSTRAKLAESISRLARVKKEQAAVKAALAASENRLQQREMFLARRMAVNYRQGPVRYASVILGSRSMGELVSRAQVVRSVVRYDARLIAQIKADRIEVLRWKAAADAKAQQAGALMAELAARQVQEAAELNRLRQVQVEVKQRRREFEGELTALEEDSNNIASRLRTLAETPVGRVRRLMPLSSGGFIHPVDARITSGFGMRYHPILHYTKLHTGTDFGAGYGSTIHAAASGVIVVAGSMRGYGNTIVIDHGGGVSTLYGHCSALLVTEGQTINQGDPIGRVGATGYATGPHLHFEVRRDGQPVDPMGYL